MSPLSWSLLSEVYGIEFEVIAEESMILKMPGHIHWWKPEKGKISILGTERQ